MKGKRDIQWRWVIPAAIGTVASAVGIIATINGSFIGTLAACAGAIVTCISLQEMDSRKHKQNQQCK